MKILIVGDDDGFHPLLARELEHRGCDVRQLSSGDEAFDVWQQLGPWEFVLADYRFMRGVKIKDRFYLLTAIHEIHPHQRMAMMTADPEECREKLPKALWHLPVLLKPFKVEQLLRVLREPVLPL